MERDIRRVRRGFGYDVSVAALANLVAASVTYLFAYGGYLDKNTDLVVLAVAIIMAVLVAVLASVPGRAA